MTHFEPSPLAGKTVRIKAGLTDPVIPAFGGSEIVIMDWFDRVTGICWMYTRGNRISVAYSVRLVDYNNYVARDNEVLIGEIQGEKCLVHITEIEEATNENNES